MLSLDLRVLLDRYQYLAGETITGTIHVTPPRASTSSTVTISSLIVTAKCTVNVRFEDGSDWRNSITYPYRIEKQVFSKPTEVSRNTKVRFEITLPKTSQWSPVLFNSSPRFEHKPGHPIPPNHLELVTHTLTAEARTSSKLFTRGKREIPYHFVSTRDVRQPLLHMRAESQSIRSQPAKGWRRSLEIVTNSSHSSGFPATAELKVQMPSQVCLGGPLPILLAPFYNENHQCSNAILLQQLDLRLIARHSVRAKLARNMPGKDAEAEQTVTEKIDLVSVIFSGSPVAIYDGMKLHDYLPSNLIEAQECVPSFKTYNAALRYTLELSLVISVRDRKSIMVYRRNVEVLPGTFREPAMGMAGMAGMQRLDCGEMLLGLECEEAPPAYSDPPPEYMVARNAMIAV